MREPFADEPFATLVVPFQDPDFAGQVELLKLEGAWLEANLGTKVGIARSDPGRSARWLLELDQAHAGPATISFDSARTIVSRAADSDGLLETFSLLHTVLRQGGGTVAATDVRALDEAIERVIVEVGDTYPSFELRGLDWSEICERHVERVRSADDRLAAFQEWLAELEDAHTWVHAEPRPGNLPYAVGLAAGAATFVCVPRESAGYAAGVRPGWEVIAVGDGPVDVAAWLRRTAASPHARPYVAGRRLLAGPIGEPRSLVAVSPDGERAEWEESPGSGIVGDLVSWHRLSSGAGYVRVRAWIDDGGVDEALDAAFLDFRAADRLVFDVRGNPGGNLVLACRTRSRFLRAQTTVGTIRYSVGGGELSEPIGITAEPAPAEQRWPGRLVLLTDALTYSSSEDFLLGLHGLDHVTVVGQPTGGGSGRARTIRLLPELQLTVSAALTYERDGQSIEGAGIPPDVRSPVFAEADDAADPALASAEAL